jgi:hypothetical protein
MIEVTELPSCEISPVAASIQHNHPTIPHAVKGRWFLSAISTGDTFVFVHASRVAKVVRYAKDGWDWDIAHEFSSTLNAIHQ